MFVGMSQDLYVPSPLSVTPFLSACLERSFNLSKRKNSIQRPHVTVSRDPSKRTLAKNAASVKTLIPTCARALDMS